MREHDVCGVEQLGSGPRGFARSVVQEILNRPFPITVPMIALMVLVPGYVFIGELLIRGRTLHVPEVALDRLVPLQPSWVAVYASLYLFAILPVFVVRREEQLRRTFWALLSVWIVAYAFFLVYPTASPRPVQFAGDAFFAWILSGIYGADVPYNCFPSLHVAHSFVAALACHRVHRGVGIAAGVWAALIGVSTVFTKQHYVLDVVAGIALAYAAYLVFLSGSPRDAVAEGERRLAPQIALGFLGVHGLTLFGLWVAYRIGGGG